MICKSCHVGYMLSHPEHHQDQQGWKKCSICGYCQNVKPKINWEEVVEEFINENPELWDALDDRKFQDLKNKYPEDHQPEPRNFDSDFDW